MDTFVGFDSAWTNSPQAPGAVCAVTFADGAAVDFHSPRLATFDQALAFIQKLRSRSEFLLVAIDQPTIVPNMMSMRPVERVAASLVSWLGGGVQPANRGRLGMFCDASPIWKFLKALGATEDPEHARIASEGQYVMEVFPALALASLVPACCGRLKRLCYNPGRKKAFHHNDWVTVAEAASLEARTLGCDELARWCTSVAGSAHPKKADQDQLDAAICLLIALRWRLRPREESLMLGDLASGYMIFPASSDVRERLTVAARKLAVPVNGLIPEPPRQSPEAGASRFAATADDIGMMGNIIGSVSEMRLGFWLDAPDEAAKLGETVAESLPRIAISHVRQHGNSSESLSLLKSHLESAAAAADILIEVIEPDGSAGVRFAYALSQGQEKVSVVLKPMRNPAILLGPLAPGSQG